jgi:hypothetical protein
MHRSFRTAVDLVDIAALVTLRGPTMARIGTIPVMTHVESYWRASRARHDEWRNLIHSFYLPTIQPKRPMSYGLWSIFRGLTEEVFASDPLVRCWNCVVEILAEEPCEALRSFCQSVMIGQMEARHQLMEILYDLRGLDESQAKVLDQVRRSTERWSDMLLGYLSGWGDITDLAFELDHALDFAHTFHEGTAAERRAAESVLLEGLGSSASRVILSCSPHPELNERIATSILASLRPDILDATGKEGSLWQTRLQRNTEEVSHWLDRLRWEYGIPREQIYP